MKKILLMVMCIFTLLSSFARAQQTNVELLPEWNEDKVIEYVSWVSVWWEVMERQKDLVKNGNMSMADQIRSWIMWWDTILDYCAYLARFLGEVALLVGALAIIFLWYKRITKNVFWESPKGLTMVIIWLLVIIFAYVIIKIIWFAFIS